MKKNYWYDEENIKGVMIEYLKSKNFKIMPETFRKKGVDIKSLNNKLRRYWFIEVKGYPRHKKSLHSQIYNSFNCAIGQILSRMRQKYGYYGIALPDFKIYEKKSIELSIARNRNKLNIFLIDENKNIRQLTPNSKKFKEIKGEKTK